MMHNRSFNDSKSTITLEEEIMEDYEPTPQEVREYAIHLGMNLPEDNQYLDIARAGLKAQLPQEWKVCQKIVNGQEEIFYKNIQTKEVCYDHPCDLIYKKKYMEAKQIDGQKVKKKKTGVDKLKQNIQQYRGDGILEGPDDQSFLMESNAFQQNNQANYVIQNPSALLQNSATQNLLQQVDQEFANLLQDFENDKKVELTKMKEDNKQRLNKMELMLMNEADPDLFELKEEYERRKEQMQKNAEEKQKKVKRKVEDELEDNLAKQKQQIAKQLERNIENYEFEQEKVLKNKLRVYEQDQQVSHKDIIRRINQRQKELSDSDSKWMKQLQDKKKNVELQLAKVKKEITFEINEKLAQIEQENNKKLRQEQDIIKKKLMAEADQMKREYKFEIIDLQEANQKMMRSIKEDVKSIYDPKMNQLQQEFTEQIQNIELSESRIIQSQIIDYRNQDIETKKLENIEKFNQKKEKLILQLQTQLVTFERTTTEKYMSMKKNLEDSQRQKLEQIQRDYEKRTGKSLGKGQEIDLCMEVNQTKSTTHQLQDEIRQLKRRKVEMQEKLSQLNIVVQKYDLQNELKQKEVIKFDLERLQFTVEKLKQDDKVNDKELDLLDAQFQQIIRKHQEQQMKQQSMQNMLQSVNELKEMLASQSNETSKMQSNLFRQTQQQKPEINIQNNPSSMNASVLLDENAVLMRKWKSILLDERVALNREREQYKRDKDILKQLERKILADQDNVKKEIQLAKQIDQNNIKKELLKKMKAEVQNKILKLSEDISKMNNRRSLLKQRMKALDQMESTFNECNNNPQYLHSIEQLFILYSKIGDNEIVDDLEGEQESRVNESYFNQLKVISESQPNIEEPTYQLPRMHFYDHIGQLTEQKFRMEIVSQKDWLQNYKYRMIGTNPYSIDSRERLQRYQDFLHCKV